MRHHPVSKRSGATFVDLPAYGISHYREDPDQTNQTGQPSHIEKTDQPFVKPIPLESENRDDAQSDRHQNAGGVQDPLRRIRFVDVAPDGAGAVRQQQSLDRADLGKVFSWVDASQRSGWAIL